MKTMKRIVLFLVVICCALAQTDQVFDVAYWASHPPEVRALKDSGSEAACQDLAVRGFTVDVPIMCWGWSPYLVMKMRDLYGYTWVPSALQPNIKIAPGLSMPGVEPYDPRNPPPGSIKVSTRTEDYPPFDPPKPPATPIASAPVGAHSFGSIYLANRGDDLPDGSTWKDERGEFRKRIIQTPFGRSQYWEKVQN